MTKSIDVLVLTGPPGVGKTTLGKEMFDQLAERDVAHAVIDIDALCLSFPFRPGDGFNDLTATENLRSVWSNYRAQEIDKVILVRVVETVQDVRRLADAIPGANVVVCKLIAGPATVEGRLRQREIGSGTEKLVARGRHLAESDADRAIVDMVVQTEDVPLDRLAIDVLVRAGWLA